MSLIHEALKKAYKEKTETQPPVPTTAYVQPEITLAPKSTKNWTNTLFSIVLAISILAMLALYVSMTTERNHRRQAEMTLAQKEENIADLKREVTVLTEQNRIIEEQSVKDKQDFLAKSDLLNQQLTKLSQERDALVAELAAKKKALGTLSYRLHQLSRGESATVPSTATG